MKKFIYTFFLSVFATAAALVFNSCGNDSDIDPLISGSYVFYEPLWDWNMTEADIRTAMKTKTEWFENTDNEQANELVFENKKTRAEYRFTFEKGKYYECAIFYYGCNDKFNQMKQDWTNKLNLTWKDTNWGFIEAQCPEKQCDVTLQNNSASGLDYMIVSFIHSAWY